MEITFPYEYYIIAINHRGKRTQKIITGFAGINSFTNYTTGWNLFEDASHFDSERKALEFFGKYKERLMADSDMFEAFNPRIIKVTCIEDPIVEGNSERSL